jgi:hypothetical protein
MRARFHLIRRHVGDHLVDVLVLELPADAVVFAVLFDRRVDDGLGMVGNDAVKEVGG